MMRIALLPLAAALMAAAPTTPPAAIPPPGAESCTGCHVKGGGMGLLQGLPAADDIAALEAFRTGKRTSTVMGRIVKGFTEDEVAQIALWFAKQ
jgi:cytochrome c553